MQKAIMNKPVWAHSLFFPAACIYASMAVPLSVFAMASGWPEALLGQGHAFEMLFGFALAVVAGYTLGPTQPKLLDGLLMLWLFARIAQFGAPFSVQALAFSGLFGLALAWHIVPRFLAAKKWRNRMLIPLLGGLCLLPAAYLLAQKLGTPFSTQLILHEAVLFFAMLMAFMGGRIIAPAVAGEFHKQGRELDARVQPRIEAAFIILLVVATSALLVPGGNVIAGLACVVSGLLIGVRLLRWQLWYCRSRLDLIGLCIGYGWLGLGLCLFGLAIATNSQQTGVLHIITVGALGSLTSGVMSRIHYQRLRRTPPPSTLVVWMLTTVAIATLLRVAATLFASPNQLLLLSLAAVAWTLCFAVLGWLFVINLYRSIRRSRSN